MKKLLPTTLISFCLIGLYMAIMIGIQSCGDKAKSDTEQSLGDKVEDVADTYSEDSFFEDSDSPEGEEAPSDGQASTDDESYSDEDDDSYTSSSSSNSYTTSTSKPCSGHLVVAGNYLLEDNANAMVKKLRNQGYQGAEKVVFDLSQYYTVIAGRYETNAAAGKASRELKNAGIDNYVVAKK